MKIDRNKHAAFLEDELNVQIDDFKRKLRTSAVHLMSRNEMFVGLYVKFHANGEMLMMLPTSRGIPRKNEYYYCFLLPENLRKYREWGSATYQNLISQELCATDLKCIWYNKSETPGFVLVGFSHVSLEFKARLEKNCQRVALALGPKVPPYEYLSNLHKMVLSDAFRFDPILDSDYETKPWAPILVDGDTDIIDIAKEEFGHSDIFTLQGPPGTGKTYRIARLCEKLCSQGKSVLVTALTNVALMSVAEKLKEKYVTDDFAIYKTSLTSDEEAKCPFIKSIDDVVAVKGALVLSTFYKMSYAALAADTFLFDYVIVDEASQAFIATLAAAKRLGKKAVWVGDINQMPPISLLSENWINREGYAPLVDGLQTFVQSFNHTLFQLTTTYRLGIRGARFTGMFYNDTLKSATTSTSFEECAMDGPVVIKMPLAIGDTSPKNGIEEVIRIIKKVQHTKSKEIAVLSHRIETIVSIQRRLAEEEDLSGNIVVDTVARVQGMTKDVVIYLIPNTDCMIYSLEKRLFNVATSRARNNTYIIIDKDYASCQFADSLVVKYLETAECNECL